MEPPRGETEKQERENSILTDLTTRMTQLLNQSQTQIPHQEPTTQIGVKLDGTNYALWSQIVEMYISGKDKLGYINGDIPEPLQTDPTFKKWRMENAIVKGWLINSMDPSLVGNFIRFSTAKAIWDNIATTYFDGTDTSQVYDLKRRVSRLKQGGIPLETYYNNLQGLWREIDFRRPNPMVCNADVLKYNSILQEDRVYTFLDGLDDRLDKIRADVLQTQPFPTVEQAYGQVRREDLRQSVMRKNEAIVPGGAMLSKGGQKQQLSFHAPSYEKASISVKPKSQSEGAGCTHCGNAKHTKETCFKLHGYPEWWHELKAKKKRESNGGDNSGRAALMSVEPKLSLVPQQESSTSTNEQNNDPGKQNSVLHGANQRNCSSWIVDSGATDHMTYDPHDLYENTQPRRTCIANANGVIYPVTGAGTVAFSHSFSLPNTLLVPSLSSKLLSVGEVTEELNCCALMYPTFCLFQDILTKEIIGRGTKREGLYYMDDFSLGRANIMHSVKANERQIWLWHNRLGHPSFRYLKYLFQDLFSSFKESDFKCETCIQAKGHRVPYAISLNKCDAPFSIIHSDVWGPAPLTLSSGVRWFVTFVDDCTRMTWLYLLKNKHEVFEIFRSFHNMIKTQFSAKLKILRSDNGGEYDNTQFRSYFLEHGLHHETSCSQTPQQNGVAERKNRHIMEITRALLIAANVPKRFWTDAAVTAVYLMNRMPSRVLKFKTPLQVLAQYVTLPSVLMLSPKRFGCVAYIYIHKNQRTKLDPCAVRCIFLGYAAHKKGYRCYDPVTRRLYTTMDVSFIESENFFTSQSSHSSLQGEMMNEEQNWENWPGYDDVRVDIQSRESMTSLIEQREENAEAAENAETEQLIRVDQNAEAAENDPQDAENVNEQPFSEVTVPQTDQSPENIPEVQVLNSPENSHQNISSVYKLPFRHNRGQPPNRYSPDHGASKSKYPIANYISTQKLSEPLKAWVHNLSSVMVPNTMSEAMNNPTWVQAIEEEMRALQDNNTWALVPLPKGKKTVGCRWVFSIKHKADGTIERFKARLVAKGYTQTYGIDYQETFSPVAKLKTVRVLISLAANLDWPLHQFDVKNAFLHGDLKEEVYMDIPPGFSSSTQEKVVCKLQKALYGLKQSPRAWFGRFSLAMRKYGFKQSNSDHTLFLKHRQGKVTALIIYVDDMIITGDDKEEISRLEKHLATEFEMKNLGGLKYFLGIEVARSEQGIFLCQRKYVLDLLAETKMLECKPVDTPVVQSHGLGEFPDQIPTNKERYQRLVGKLIYLSHTRPDIAYAVSLVSQFMHSPSEDHMSAVIRILQYLKSSPGRGIMFRKNKHLRIDGFTDADWAGNITDRKSTSGYFTFVGGNLVTWRSKKQKVVALSSAEAEFRGMAKGLSELLWLKGLLEEIRRTSQDTMNLFCDNKAAIAIAHNPVQHDRTKHVEVDRHFIKQKLEDSVIQFPFVK